MQIEIGRGPDFQLTRGRELLSYRFEINEVHNTRVIVARPLTDRSLAMISKAARSFLIARLTEMESTSGNIAKRDEGIAYEVKDSSWSIRIIFRGPHELSRYKRRKILDELIRLINLPNFRASEAGQ